MNREEHIQWAKDRAIACLPQKPRQAFASMMSDLSKHEETTSHPKRKRLGGILPRWIRDPVKVRAFIEGFD